MVEFTGPRVYGYTEPANHVSLTANPGYLRYSLDRMTHYDGFLNNYQTTYAYHSCCNHDPGLELQRQFSGAAWTLDVKASYYMPFSNGRDLTLRVYFGDGGPGTYYLHVGRSRDGPWPQGTPETAPVLLRLAHKVGPNLSDIQWLEDTYAPPASSDTYFYRLERDGGIVTVKWSADGSSWTTAFTHDLGTQLEGLQQRVVITGHSWYTPAGSYADYDYIRLQPADGENIAFNPTQTGFPHPLESDRGWGGGSYPWEMLDGHTYYTDTWAHGLAFTGGFPGWIEPCGWRQATVNFGTMKTFNKMRVYHHGDEHIPTNRSIEYWDGSAWHTVNASTTLREDLRVPPPGVSGWGAVPTEHIFSPVSGSKVRFGFNNCDIQHGWIYELEVYAAAQTGPRLVIPEQVPGFPNHAVTLPVQFTRNGSDLATTIFSVDYDQTCLQFDPTDADGDGNPDAVTFNLPAAFRGSVTFDGNDADGELDFFIGDTFPPLSALPDSTLASIEFQIICQPPPGNPTLARVGFSTDPAASFGATNGQSVQGTTADGSVAITPIPRGDCNADTRVDAGDISATVLEIFDGDGNLPQNAPGGTFPGNPIGCNANADTQIDAGDISCTVLLIFNGQAACGASLRSPEQAKVERSAPVPSLGLLEAKNNGDQLTVPIQFNPGGYAISSLVFALAYDPAVAGIDPTDADGNGIPDAVALNLPNEFQAGVILNNHTGLLQVMVADGAAPLAQLPQQIIARVTWDVKADVTADEIKIGFSKETPASFGDAFGRSIPGAVFER